MEELLNKLIKKGWKPFGYNDFTKATVEENENVPWKKIIHLWTDLWIDTESLIRSICMKESWLWQFVCENEMVNEKNKHERILDPTFWEWWADCKRQEHDWNYGYRLIESALCDEDELEQFLLDTIKVE